jgi:O-antigen ligase
MAPLLVQGIIYSCYVLGLIRPFWALCGFLFLIFLQPEFIWRFEGLAGLSYQQPIIVCIIIGVLLNPSQGNGFHRNVVLLVSSLSLVLIMWASSLVSIRPAVSELYFDVLWKSVLIMLLIVHVVNSPQKAIYITAAAALGSSYNAFRLNEDYLMLGWCRWIHDSWGFKGDSNVICLFVMPIIASSSVYFLTAKQRLPKLLALLTMLVHVHMVFILESRGAMLGLAALFATAFYLIPKSPKIIGLSFLVVSIVALFAGPPVIKEFQTIFAAKENRDASAESRFTLWKAAFLITCDYPLLGVGPYAGQYMIPQYADVFQGLEVKHPHNIFGEVASGSGVLGLACYLITLTTPMIMAYRLRRKYSDPDDSLLQFLTLTPMVSIPALAVTGMFCGSGMMESIYYFTGISFGGIVSYQRLRDEEEQRSDEDELAPEGHEEFDEVDVLPESAEAFD